jgi:hypothetical protein
MPGTGSPATRGQTGDKLTLYGVAAVTFMMLMYALEHRDRSFILALGCGYLLSSIYGFLAGAWPLGVVEVVWAGIAFNRYRRGYIPNKHGESAAPGIRQLGSTTPGLARTRGPPVVPGLADVGEPLPRALDLCRLGTRRLQLG